MTKRNDGDQAFPTGDPTHGGNEGMTLRDWFAGQALIGMAANDIRSGEMHNVDVWAANAYNLADAMLEARSKEPAQ